MKKLMLMALLVLGGCAGVQNAYQVASGSAVTPQEVYIIANAFDAVELTAKSYDQLPLCSTSGTYACRTMSVVRVIDRAVRTGIVARRALIAYVTANPGHVVPVTNYNALVVAVNTVQSYLASVGVTK